jgi:hypothetical protein
MNTFEIVTKKCFRLEHLPREIWLLIGGYIYPQEGFLLEVKIAEENLRTIKRLVNHETWVVGMARVDIHYESRKEFEEVNRLLHYVFYRKKHLEGFFKYGWKHMAKKERDIFEKGLKTMLFFFEDPISPRALKLGHNEKCYTWVLKSYLTS